jgi:hypothetical protein
VGDLGGIPVLPLFGLGVLLLLAPVLVLLLALGLLGLRTRVRRLEARVAELEARVAGPGEPLPAPVAVPAPTGAPAAAGPTRPSEGPVGPEAAAGVTPPWAAPAAAGPERPAGGAVGAWEGRIGAMWLARLGALLLVLGAGFFVKHAFDSEWIDARGRVALGVLAGVALLAWGVRLARDGAARVPGQSLAAAGLGVLHVSLYAAHARYGLAGPVAAIAAMAVVTATGVAIALRLDAWGLAALATVGGLLAPALLDAGADAGPARLAYLAILDGGVLVVASRRGWTGLALLAFAGTWALYGGWVDQWYEADRLPLALGWATAYFLAFAWHGLRGPRTPAGPGRLPLAHALLILAGPAVYVAAVRRVLEDPSGRRLAGVAVALGTLYLAAAWLVRRSPRGGARAALLHGAVGVALLTVAPAAWLGRQDLAIAWSVEGLVLLWGGFRLGSPRLRLAALGVDLLAWGRWVAALSGDTGPPGTFLLAHPALPATIAVSVTAGLGALLYRAREPSAVPLARAERLARPVLGLVAVLSVAVLLSAELGQFRTLVIPPPYIPVVKSVVWMLAAMALLGLARGDRTRVLLVAASVLLVALAGETVREAGRWERIQLPLRPPVRNPRFLAGCLLVVLAWLYGQVARGLPYLGERARGRLAAAGAAGAALLFLWNLSAELLLMPLPETGLDPVKLRSAALSVLWALYAVAAMGWGLVADRAWLRVGAMALFALTVFKVLMVDLAGLDAVYRILSVLVLGAALLGASFLYARWRRRAAASEAP